MPVPRLFTNCFTKIEFIGDGCLLFTCAANKAAKGKRTKRRTGEVIVPASALPEMIAQASYAAACAGIALAAAPIRQRMGQRHH